MAVDKKTLDELALTQEEYTAIVARLGREPNGVELGMFGALWSEHCGYKHSKPLLGLFPKESPRLLVELGAENAGVVDIGDGLVVVMKIESHNHPSAIEPLQGAATGVGGIVRDILSMGARPIALLNSLRFGPLDDSRNRRLFDGIVSGISWYGNCIGVPDVGGEIAFSSSYNGNPLVNALCVGIARREDLVFASASGEGNSIILIGADTGRDGIHGASGLASRSFEEEREMRPTVQVGNPFLEKVLIEACLEIAGTDALVGMQDLGAAGLTSSAVESAARASNGLELDVGQIPRRESGMTPYDVMLSESQERMLLVVKKGSEDQVRAICEKWDVHYALIGKVTAGNLVRIWDNDVLEAELPTEILTDPPLYYVQGEESKELVFLKDYDLATVPLPEIGPTETLREILRSSNITSREWVFRQYDHQVQTNTVVGPGGDAAVLRLKGTNKGLALSTDGNGRYCYLDPYVGGAITVAEACRNLVCSGAEPVAITDCLNFGDPDKPAIAYQLEQCIRGMSAACGILGTPVISGNVSLYNETRGEAVYPTPVVGALGLLDDVTLHVTSAFKQFGDVVVMLGASQVDGDPSGMAGSEYLEVFHGLVAGAPSLDLSLEANVQRACLRAIRAGLIVSAHDCSDGGLAVALAESSVAGNIGFTGDFQISGRWDAALFGEAQSRIVVSVSPDRLQDLEAIAFEEDVPWTRLGVTGENFVLPEMEEITVSELADALSHGLQERSA